MAQRRDRLGRFSGGGGGGSRMKSSTGRTVKGGGEKMTGPTRKSRNRREDVNTNLRVDQHKGFDKYHKSLGKLTSSRRRARKLEKSGADPTKITAAKKRVEQQNAEAGVLRKMAYSTSRKTVRRYRNATGLVAQRRFARPN
jgi:hypothetical protein